MEQATWTMERRLTVAQIRHPCVGFPLYYYLCYMFAIGSPPHVQIILDTDHLLRPENSPGPDGNAGQELTASTQLEKPFNT
uniref:Uncharacterized protein n=1 Tax=Romanomermis culicivorax TaxID=13658 RepID=A0A915HLN3_ROMCU